jgi:DNA modification methylase
MQNNIMLLGDAAERLKEFEENSVDLVVTSPPYDNLRSYNGVGDTWNHEKFKEIAKELVRVLKPGGVIVWVVNDKTEKGSKTGTSFRQALYFMELGLNLNDTMIWCLSGGQHLYVKSQKGVMPMTIKDMVRLEPSTVQLWDGIKWVDVVGWKENKNTSVKTRIQLRSGENIYCTKEHRWVLENGDEVLTKDLKVGDVLKMCKLPETNEHNPFILTDDILWLLGLYIAEGSHADDTIEFSLCSDEFPWVEKINSTILSVGGTTTYTLNGDSLNVRCYSKIFNAIISQYIGGRTAKDKHLNSICWKLSNDKLKKIMEGYLDGDGSFDKKNNRWRLGFTENSYWERDLRTLAARLGAKLTLLRKGARIKSLNKIYPSLKGEWRWSQSNHYNNKKMSEILLITEEKKKDCDKMWDIEVDSDEHLFSLSSGVITHNCKTNPMPVVKQPRYNPVFEYMFVFSKGRPNTFNPLMEPCKCAGQVYDSTCKNMGGENGRTHKTFNINKEKVMGNIWEIAVAQNKDSGKHPAVFPIEIPLRHIKSWTNEGDIVLDPFMGSGTTALAALQLNRKFIGIEMNEEYYNLCNERIERYGKKNTD